MNIHVGKMKDRRHAFVCGRREKNRTRQFIFPPGTKFNESVDVE
jgi:hypothetical protein